MARTRQSEQTVRGSRNKQANQPTHKLKLWDPVANVSVRVGAGWVSDNGSISLKINRGTVINWSDLAPFGAGLILTLWPADDYHEEE